LAIINGRIHAAGDKLPGGDDTAPFEIKQVLPYKVLLKHEGKTFELKYAETGLPAGTPRRAAMQSAPAPLGKSSAVAKAAGGDIAPRPAGK
jgi:hypothetical protein